MPIGTNAFLASAAAPAAAAEGPWTKYQTGAPSPTSPPVAAPSGPWTKYGSPSAGTVRPQAIPVEPDEMEVKRYALADRSANRADNAADRAVAADAHQNQIDEIRLGREAARDARAAQNDGKVSDGAADKLNDAVNAFGGLDRAYNNFTDDFSGLGAGVENGIQSVFSGFGTPGQRQWWADFAATDNAVRNALFGASLSEGEKAAFNATTVQPGMDPNIIRQNLRERLRVAKAALDRRSAFLAANGGNQNAINQLLGEYVSPGWKDGHPDPAAAASAAQASQRGQPAGDLTFNDQMPQAVAKPLNLSPDQTAAMQALVQHGGTPEAMAALAQSFGAQIKPEDAAALHKFYADPAHRNITPDVNVDNSIKPVDAGDGAIGAAARGVADSATLGFLDEAGALADSLQGNGTYDQALDRRRGMAAFDEEKHGTARMVGQVAGGAVLPVGEAKSFGELAKVGAGYGAAYGAGSADGGVADRIVGGVTGGVSGLAGTVAGAGIGKAAGIGSKALAGIPTWKRAAEKALPVVEAAERQKVPITVADAAPGARGVYSALESIPLAGGKINRALDKGNDAIERRVSEVGGPDVVDQQTLGETIRTAGTNYVDRSKKVVDRAYEVARIRSGGQQITPTEALRTLDDHIAELSRAPETNAEVIGLLQKYRADMVDAGGAAKPLDLDVIRGMRSGLRGKTNTDGLRGTDAERRVGQVLDGASRDIDAQLTGGAKQAWQRGDRLHKGRAEHIDRVVETFIGGKGDAALSAEKIANNVTTMAGPRRGDAATLGKMMGTLKPEERSQVASTIAAQLGRRGDEAGENAFSSSAFFSQLQKYSPAARKAIWGEQGAADLADLAKIAEARGQVIGKLNNSASGRNVNFYRQLTAILGSGIGAGAAVGGAAGSIPGAAAAVGASYLSAKALSSPRFVSALAYAARANTLPKQGTAIRRLAALAAKEPALSGDLIPIKEKLEEAWVEDHRSRER